MDEQSIDEVFRMNIYETLAPECAEIDIDRALAEMGGRGINDIFRSNYHTAEVDDTSAGYRYPGYRAFNDSGGDGYEDRRSRGVIQRSEPIDIPNTEPSFNREKAYYNPKAARGMMVYVFPGNSYGHFRGGHAGVLEQFL